MIRDPTQQYELPADQAEMRIHAFTIEGSVTIPASLMAMTHGEELAFPVPDTSPGFLGSTIRPIRKAPRT